MTLQSVNDFLSNVNENIEVAAKTLAKSPQRQKVFDAVYTGKKKVKTVADISAGTQLTEKQVLMAGKVLYNHGLVEVVRPKGRIAYQKRDHIHHYKNKILSLARSKAKLAVYPTKRKPAGTAARMPAVMTLKVVTKGLGSKVRQITIDEISSFSKVKPVTASEYISDSISEATLRDAIKGILGELGKFKDWGGEQSDLFSSQLRLSGRRRVAAFAFKGPGMTGKLTPGKMGKNGDQIQRLFGAPAEVFIVQYGGQVLQSVYDDMKEHAYAKAAFTGGDVYWGVIEGTDSHRLLLAYPKQFSEAGRANKRRRKKRK